MLPRSTKTVVFLALTSTCLVACNSGGGAVIGTVTSNVTSTSKSFSPSNLPTPSTSTLIIPSLTAVQSGPIVVDKESDTIRNTLGTVAYSVTAYDDGNADAESTRYARSSEIDPFQLSDPFTSRDTSIANVPDSGSATLTGDVGIASATRTGTDSLGVAQYDVKNQTGELTLEADLANATLKGSSSLLAVDGVFDGQSLTGTVTHNGVGGALNGRIAQITNSSSTRDPQTNGVISTSSSVTIRALGAFAGSDNARGITYSGGFSVSD